MADAPDFTAEIRKDTRFFPCLLGALVLALFLLFFKELKPFLQTYFVPSLAVYVLGTGVVAWLQTMQGIRSNDGIINNRQFNCIIALHLLWLVAFVSYNIWRLSQMPPQ